MFVAFHGIFRIRDFLSNLIDETTADSLPEVMKEDDSELKIGSE